MKSENSTIKASDGQELFVYRWLPDGKEKIKAVIHIIHGMGEHAGRYSEFASRLTDEGFAVFAADQRGHGKTAKNPEEFGHFADRDGWFTVIQDLKQITDLVSEENPGRDIFLFGHSAGAFLALDYLFLHPGNIKGVILSGTAATSGLMGHIGIMLAKLFIKRGGPRVKSPLHKKLTFEAYNNYFKPNRTRADWVSRDTQRVDAMVNDPYCYTLFSATFYMDLIKSTHRINKLDNIKKIPKNLPILIIAGTKCSVGNYTKGTSRVFNDFKKAGLDDVDLKLYPDARHELINELNREEVFEDIIGWLNEKS